MPLLNRNTSAEPRLPPSALSETPAALRLLAGGRLPVCANPECQGGWMRRWRPRQSPTLEGAWTCSAECMQARVRELVRRELEGRSEAPVTHRHRVPLGLVLLSQGAVTAAQLRGALELQRAARQRVGAQPRLGLILMRHYGIAEQSITQALRQQWNCPELTLDGHLPEQVAALAPRLFVDAFGMLPLRVAGGQILYVAFEDRIDRCLTLALERMTGLAVEPGIMRGSQFTRAHAALLGCAFPRIRLVETDNAEAMVAELARQLEQVRPVEARLLRLHDYFWLRMWRRQDASARDTGVPRRDAVEDVLCALRGAQ